MTVKAVKSVETLLSAFNNTLKGTEWEGIIPEPTRLLSISYAVFCLKKKKPDSE